MIYIEQYVPYGKGNAISRSKLSVITGIPDRKMRDAIKRANKRLELTGRFILSSSHVCGYWLSDDQEEIDRYILEVDRRIRTQYLNDEPIRRYRRKLTGENTVHVRGYTRRALVVSEVDGQITLGDEPDAQ